MEYTSQPRVESTFGPTTKNMLGQNVFSADPWTNIENMVWPNMEIQSVRPNKEKRQLLHYGLTWKVHFGLT